MYQNKTVRVRFKASMITYEYYNKLTNLNLITLRSWINLALDLTLTMDEWRGAPYRRIPTPEENVSCMKKLAVLDAFIRNQTERHGIFPYGSPDCARGSQLQPSSPVMRVGHRGHRLSLPQQHAQQGEWNSSVLLVAGGRRGRAHHRPRRISTNPTARSLMLHAHCVSPPHSLTDMKDDMKVRRWYVGGWGGVCVRVCVWRGDSARSQYLIIGEFAILRVRVLAP